MYNTYPIIRSLQWWNEGLPSQNLMCSLDNIQKIHHYQCHYNNIQILSTRVTTEINKKITHVLLSFNTTKYQVLVSRARRRKTCSSVWTIVGCWCEESRSMGYWSVTLGVPIVIGWYSLSGRIDKKTKWWVVYDFELSLIVFLLDVCIGHIITKYKTIHNIMMIYGKVISPRFPVVLLSFVLYVYGECFLWSVHSFFSDTLRSYVLFPIITRLASSGFINGNLLFSNLIFLHKPANLIKVKSYDRTFTLLLILRMKLRKKIMVK